MTNAMINKRKNTLSLTLLLVIFVSFLVGFLTGFGVFLVGNGKKANYQVVSELTIQAGFERGFLPIGTILVLDEELPELTRYKTYVNITGTEGIEKIEADKSFLISPLDGYVSE